MDSTLIFGIIILFTLLFLFYNNYKLLLVEKMNNRFTNSSICCGDQEIEKCNSFGKTCVCDYFRKNSYFCQNAF